MIKLVTYDLHKPEKDYAFLFKALKTYDHIHPLGSVWFLKTGKNISEVMTHLKEHVDKDDSLIITGLDGWSLRGLSKQEIQWLRN